MPAGDIPWVLIAASGTEDQLTTQTNEWMRYIRRRREIARDTTARQFTSCSKDRPL